MYRKRILWHMRCWLPFTGKLDYILVSYVNFFLTWMESYCDIYFFVRGTTNGNEFMRKQELIDAAEASGLSRVSIAYVNSWYLVSDIASQLCLVVLEGAIDAYRTVLVLRAEKGKGKPAQFGSSPRDWYTGWSCMKTLITKGLAVKSSCPAK